MKKVVQLLFVFGIGCLFICGSFFMPQNDSSTSIVAFWGGLFAAYGGYRLLSIAFRQIHKGNEDENR